MYWNMTSLTKMGSIVHHAIKGKKQDAIDYLRFNELDPISIYPDYKEYFLDILKKGRLSQDILASFFKDFSRGLKSGLSAQEVIVSLNDQVTDSLLREVLRKLNISIIDGHSFKNAFADTKVFPPIVLSVVDTAEKSGNLAEMTYILSEYFKFMNDNKIRIMKTLVYPACVFVALTVASIVISIKLVPQLGAILPAQAQDNMPTQFILAYAGFMKSYWWSIGIFLVLAICGFLKIKESKKAQIMGHLIHWPMIGDLIKEMEFTVIFLNLYVYQKSGVNILSSITNIYSNQPNYLTYRFIGIKNKVNQGYSLGEALKADDLFPSMIWMNVKKGETTGNLHQYFYEIYKYYDQKSKDSIELFVSCISPVLLSIAVAYLGLIISCFILPLYSTMSK
jgi:type IV pilus assembly protein PilC